MAPNVVEAVHAAPAAVQARAAHNLSDELETALWIANMNGELAQKASDVTERWIAADKFVLLPNDLRRGAIVVAPDVRADEAACLRLGRVNHLAIDVRDVGAWNDLHKAYRENTPVGMDQNVLRGRLHLRTLVVIAALNMPRVSDAPDLAFTRAVGTDLCLFNSESVREYEFTDTLPTAANITAIRNMLGGGYLAARGRAIVRLSAYGLLHARMGHTFKGGTAERQWFYDRFSTMLTGSQLEIVPHDDQELECRTVAHPFGDISCYALAMMTFENGLMERNLTKRVPVFFHELYPFVIAREALTIFQAQRWWRYYAHANDTDMAMIRDACEAIVDAPMRYTDRSRAYTGQPKLTIDPQLMEAAERVCCHFDGFIAFYMENSTWSTAKSLARLSAKSPQVRLEWMQFLGTMAQRLVSQNAPQFFGITHDQAEQLDAGALPAVNRPRGNRGRIQGRRQVQLLAPAPQVQNAPPAQPAPAGGGAAPAAPAAAGGNGAADANAPAGP